MEALDSLSPYPERDSMWPGQEGVGGIMGACGAALNRKSARDLSV